MVLLLLPQLGELCWALAPDGDEVRLLIPAASTIDLPNGLRLRVESQYPYDGAVRIKVAENAPFRATADGAPASRRQADNNQRNFALSLRIPGWCRDFTLAVNGQRVRTAGKDGFVSIPREWTPGDTVSLVLDMPVRVVRAHTNVADEAGRVALMRGPLVYALESVDNGPALHRFAIDPQQEFRLVAAKGLPRGTVAIRGEARVWERPGADLYAEVAPRARRKAFTAIPYALWQNRGPAEMRVWLRERLP